MGSAHGKAAEGVMPGFELVEADQSAEPQSLVQGTGGGFDPRSPTIAVQRTPLRGFNGSQALGSMLDPRSPTLNLARTPLRDVAGSYDRAAEAPTPPCIWEEDELEGSEDEEAEHDIDTPEEPVAGTAADSKPQTVGTPLRDATNGMNGSRGTLKAKTPLSKNANHTMALDEYLKAEKTFTHTTATPVKKGLSQQPAGLATKALQGRQDHCRVFADSSDHTSADVQSRPTTHLSSTAPPMDRWW